MHRWRPGTKPTRAKTSSVTDGMNGTVYGMNFDRTPELDSRIGHRFSLLLMALVSTALYLVFKRRGWF